MVVRLSPLSGLAAVLAPTRPDGADAFSSDQELMQAVAEGHAGARRRLADRLVNRTRKIARALLGSGADADDAAQQALFEILAAAPGYRGEASIETWSKRITVRVCLKMVRTRGARVGIDVDAIPSDFGSPGLADGLPHPVQTYLDRLPDAQRGALVMRYSLELGLPEIAERTGVTIATVRYRLWTGLKRLRKWIDRDSRQSSRGEIP